MTADHSKTEETMRQGFRHFNRFMLLMWRLGLGPLINFLPRYIGRIMVITHRGRKSGLRRQTPVNYTISDGEIYCTAGYGAGSDWYRNIMADPRVEVWLPDGWYEGEAVDVSDEPGRLAIMRQVLFASGFAAYAAGIDPIKTTDDELNELTRLYRLVHIRRTAPRTGKGGPGELSWIWPLATMLLLPLALRRRRRRK